MNSRRLRKKLREFGIEGVEKFLHRVRGFVAHVGDAEGGALDLAVAAVDQEVVLRLQILDEGRKVEAFRGGEAGEGVGATAFWGEEREAVLGTPGVNHGVGLGVAGETILKAFLFDLAENVLQAEEDRDRWCRQTRRGRRLDRPDGFRLLNARSSPLTLSDSVETSPERPPDGLRCRGGRV